MGHLFYGKKSHMDFLANPIFHLLCDGHGVVNFYSEL